LKPDLVLALQFHGKAVDSLKKLKVPVLVLDCQTIQDVLDAYDVLGQRLGRVKQAAAAKARLKKRLDRIKERAGAFKRPPTVLFVIERDPGSLKEIYGVGPKNFIDELIRWAGGSNVLSDSSVPYPLVSKETLIHRNPDVIINALPMNTLSADLETEKTVWNQMPTLKAVQGGRVFCFNNGDYMVPGPTLVKLAEYLSGIFQKVESD
jgi:iron complex transport system substrate-binding protein